MKPQSFYSKKMYATGLFIILSTSALADAGMEKNHTFKPENPPLHQKCEHQPPPFGNAPLPFGLPPHLQGLGLSETQQDKIFEILYPQIPSIREHMKQHQQLTEALHALGTHIPLDESALSEISEKLASLDKTEMVNRTRVESKVFAILTPAQREQLLNQEKSIPMPRPPLPTSFQSSHRHRIPLLAI